MRKRMRYKPSKSESTFGGVVGIVFCLIGLFVVVPAFGVFGIFWTAIAVFITVRSFAMAAGKADQGSYVIEEEEASSSDGKNGQSAEARLTELQNLYDRRLITTEEYETKRKEILDNL